MHVSKKTPKTLTVRGPVVRLCLSVSTLLCAVPAASADHEAAVVQVGKQSMSVSELQRRWLELPAFQRQALGKTDKQRLEAYINRFVVPDLLLSQTAVDTASVSPERRRIIERTVLEQAMTARIRKQSEVSSPVTDADIKDYLEAHRQDFDRPERLRLFRILVATEADAQALLQKLRGLPDFDTWRNLARDKSLDRATNMRGGELGFVTADGKTDVPELQVDPALFAAAARLKDGEIGKMPIREGTKFAIVWRRGHVAAVRADPKTLAPTIRAHLREARAAQAFDETLTQLKSKYVKDLDPKRLDGVDFGETPSDKFQAGAPENQSDASTR